MNETYQGVAHSRWDCKFHVVFVPKRRRKTLFGNGVHGGLQPGAGDGLHSCAGGRGRAGALLTPRRSLLATKRNNKGNRL